MVKIIFQNSFSPGTEDCLWLSVFTRDLVSRKKRPILVWIHGGNFIRGSAADYEPDYILDEEVRQSFYPFFLLIQRKKMELEIRCQVKKLLKIILHIYYQYYIQMAECSHVPFEEIHMYILFLGCACDHQLPPRNVRLPQH